MMMIFVRVFYWVYLDVSGGLETSTEVQTVAEQPSQSPHCSQGVSPISISRSVFSTLIGRGMSRLGSHWSRGS